MEPGLCARNQSRSDPAEPAAGRGSASSAKAADVLGPWWIFGMTAMVAVMAAVVFGVRERPPALG
jgi:hypothetical protein